MKLGFIGTGRIVTAVVKGFCSSAIKNTTINLSPRSKSNSINLARTFPNVTRLKSNQLVLDNSEVIFIALPAKDSKQILSNLKFNRNHTVISFIPFLIHSKLAKLVKPAKRICRAIPLPTVESRVCPIPVYNGNSTVMKILGFIGQPVKVEDEDQLHTLWVLTGFIASFFDLLKELGSWAKLYGIEEGTANKYLVNMFHSLVYSVMKGNQINLDEIVKKAATPGGLNEQVVEEIRNKKANKAYATAAVNLLKRFEDQIQKK